MEDLTIQSRITGLTSDTTSRVDHLTAWCRTELHQVSLLALPPADYLVPWSAGWGGGTSFPCRPPGSLWVQWPAPPHCHPWSATSKITPFNVWKPRCWLASFTLPQFDLQCRMGNKRKLTTEGSGLPIWSALANQNATNNSCHEKPIDGPPCLYHRLQHSKNNENTKYRPLCLAHRLKHNNRERLILIDPKGKLQNK